MTSLAAFLVPAAIVGVTWFLSRAGADRRWRAALDRYAEREQVKRPKPPAGVRQDGRPRGKRRVNRFISC
jgi:hypothetical protein